MPASGFSPTYISTLSANCPLLAMAGAFSSISGASGWTANRAIYIPFYLPNAFQLQRFLVFNQSAACNFDFAIYNFSGSRIISTGSVASLHTSAIQYSSVSGTKLQPGRYYYGFACDTTAANSLFAAALTSGIQPIMQMTGCLMQEAAFPLPATYTPIACSTTIYPIVGITQTAS